MKRLCVSIAILVLVFFLAFQQMPTVAGVSDTYIWISSWNGSSWSTPVNITKIDYANATRYTFQRKPFKTTTGNYFATFFNWTCHAMQYRTSSNRIAWSATKNMTLGAIPISFSTYPLGMLDVLYPSKQASMNGSFFYSGSTTDSYWTPFNVTASTMVCKSSYGLGGKAGADGMSVTSNFNGFSYGVFHRTSPSQVIIQRSPSNEEDTSTSVPYGTPAHEHDSGGNQILNYKTSSPYHMMVLSKGNNSKLYWTLFNATSGQFVTDPFNDLGVTLGVGFNDFCATSEAQDIGDPEKIHLVFGNSTGLYYMKFESGAWSSVTAFGVAGTFPTLAADDSGNLVFTYVSSGKIYYKTKTPLGSWSSSAALGTGYTGAAFLSSNQNMDSGEILLVWTGLYPARAVQPYAPAFSNFYLGLVLASLSSVITVAVSLVVREDGQSILSSVILATAIFIVVFIGVILVSSFESVAPPVV